MTSADASGSAGYGDITSTTTIVNGTSTLASAVTISATRQPSILSAPGSALTSVAPGGYGTAPVLSTYTVPDGPTITTLVPGGDGSTGSSTLAGGVTVSVNPGGPVSNYTGTGSPIPFTGHGHKHTPSISSLSLIFASFLAVIL